VQFHRDMPRPIITVRQELPAQRLADAVFQEIEVHGVDGVRVSLLAERMGIGVGTLYRRWGGLEMCLEQAWRHVCGTFDQEIGRAAAQLSPEWHAFDDVWENLTQALPKQFDAFLELHTARRRWMRGDQQSDGVMLPDLSLYVDLAQRLGHLQLGQPHLIAAMIWAALCLALAGPFKHDQHRADWCLTAIKRMLFTPKSLAVEAQDFDVDVDDTAFPATATD
jgi:AcrR family transcriptional regulator